MKPIRRRQKTLGDDTNHLRILFVLFCAVCVFFLYLGNRERKSEENFRNNMINDLRTKVCGFASKVSIIFRTIIEVSLLDDELTFALNKGVLTASPYFFKMKAMNASTGWEMLPKIEREPDGVWDIKEEHKLKDKSDSEYYSQALSLPLHTIGFADIEFDETDGVINKPETAIIRAVVNMGVYHIVAYSNISALFEEIHEERDNLFFCAPECFTVSQKAIVKSDSATCKPLGACCDKETDCLDPTYEVCML